MTAVHRDDQPSVWAGWEERERAQDRCCAHGTPRSEDAPPTVFAKLLREPGCSCSEGAAPTQRALPSSEPEQGSARLPQPGERRKNRVVSGDWLARQVELDPVEAQAIAGREVEVEPEAWLALRALRSVAVRGAAVRARVDQRRATAFPGPDMHRKAPPAADEEADGVCSTCITTTIGGSRFVHATDGDDDARGTFAVVLPIPVLGKPVFRCHPWKTLDRVERWLQGEVYRSRDPADTCLKSTRVFLRCGEVWTGLEEAGGRTWSSSGFTALSVNDLKGIESSPLTLATYGTEDPPLIDGSTDSTGASTEPQYGDDRTGIAFDNCCHVYVTGVKIRGFRMAIDIRGASKDHLYESLTIYDHSTYGVRFGVKKEEVLDATGATDAALLSAVIAAGAYPEQIRVVGCAFSSIGYDTEGADVAIDFLSTNCTISDNTMEGDEVRGIDGIVSQGGSSGHDIDGNTISHHAKYCYAGESDKALLVPASVMGGVVSACADVTLVHGCEKDTDTSTVCTTATGYGYNQYFYASTSTTVADVRTEARRLGEDVQEAFGEDGIDLKGVRDRTGDGTAVTVVRNNTIVGHPNHAGITVNDGTQGVHIYNNRIYANGVGILVTNDTNQAPWYVLDSADGVPMTQDIKIYRNLVFMNTQQGIKVKSQILDVPDGATSAEDYTHRVSGVYIVNNTVAHNFYAGLQVTLGDYDEGGVTFDGSEGDVDQVYVYNNLFARNGIGAVDERMESDETKLRAAFKSSDAMQVHWDGSIDLLAATTMESDYNAYLGWEHRDLGEASSRILVIKCSDPATVKEAQGAWEIEVDGGVQASDLSELGLTDATTISGVEGADGEDLFIILSEVHSAGGLDSLISGATLLLVAYSIDSSATESFSVLVNAGTDATTVGYYSDPGVDVALSPDIDDNLITDLEPDIGAFEGPDTSGFAARSMLSGWFRHA